MNPEFKISKEQKDQYQEEGYFVLPPVVSDNYLQMLREECDFLIDVQNKEMDRLRVDEISLSRRNSRYFVFLAYKERPRLGDYIFSDLTAEICRATIGGTAYLFWEQFVAKGQDKGSEFGWHQDSGYVDHPHKPYVNCWVPLDDVNEENGTIYILPYPRAGTKEKIEHKIQPDSDDRIGYFGDDPGEAIICEAGSVVVFSSTAFHRSGANNTENMRRAYAAQFCSEIIYESDGSLKGLAEPFLNNGEIIKVS